MVDGNLACEYIDDIPWDKNPAFAFSGDTNSYMQAFKNVIDVLPVGDAKVSFNEDVWDFNPYIKEGNAADYRFIFTDVPNEIKDYCKFFVLYGIMGKRKMPTINIRYSNFKSVYSGICEHTSHKSIFVITTNDIKEEIVRRNDAPSTAHNLYESVYQVYDFLFKNYKLKLPVELKDIKSLGIKEKNLSKQNAEENKIPNIPEQYFIKILNKCLELMRNQEIDYSIRMTAAMIVILSQTGLRLGDLLCLTTNALIEKKLAKSGNITHYIHYTAKKPSKAHAPVLEFDIFSNTLATEAFNLMIKLRKTCDNSKGHKYIYVLPTVARSKDEYPLQRNRFIKEYKRLMYTYLYDDTQIEWDGITSCLYEIWNSDKKQREKVSLNIPESRQYRVHLCTALYEKGVPLVYIQRYMSHLSDYMMGYYVRPKDTYQENINYSEQVIREIVEEDITPLGGNLIGDDIKTNIQKFIKDNGFNVKTDIDTIMKELGNKVIIRGKTGGVCIKTSLMPCSKDARTNEMMCAYNLCPNLFHFYYMIDVSYLNFKTLQETYSAMKTNGNIKAAQKELNKLKDLCRRRLLPELDELEKELNKKGLEVVLDQHPSIIEVIENKDDIRKEITLWMSKN